MSEPKLTAKQRAFVHEYIKDKNGTQAAIRAGYSPRTANEQASRLLANVNIRALVDSLLQDVMEEAKIDAAWVLKQAIKLHERCMQEVDPVLNRKGEQVYDDETGRPLFVFDAKGAAAGLKLAGDNIKVQAFAQKIIHEVTEISTEDRAARADAILRLAQERQNANTKPH